MENALKQAIFEILRLHYLKFQMPTAYGLKYFNFTKIIKNGLKRLNVEKKYRLFIFPKSSSFQKKHILVRPKRVCLLWRKCLLWVETVFNMKFFFHFKSKICLKFQSKFRAHVTVSRPTCIHYVEFIILHWK